MLRAITVTVTVTVTVNVTVAMRHAPSPAQGLTMKACDWSARRRKLDATPCTKLIWASAVRFDKAPVAKRPTTHRADGEVWLALRAAPRPFTPCCLSSCPTFQGEALQRVAPVALHPPRPTFYRGVGVGWGTRSRKFQRCGTFSRPRALRLRQSGAGCAYRPCLRRRRTCRC